MDDGRRPLAAEDVLELPLAQIERVEGDLPRRARPGRAIDAADLELARDALGDEPSLPPGDPGDEESLHGRAAHPLSGRFPPRNVAQTREIAGTESRIDESCTWLAGVASTVLDIRAQNLLIASPSGAARTRDARRSDELRRRDRGQRPVKFFKENNVRVRFLRP